MSVRLLTELIEPLDAGYRAAFERRGGRRRPGSLDRALVAVGCALAGFVAVLGYLQTHRSAPATAVVHQRLVERVRSTQRTGDDLAAAVNRLQRRLAATRNAAVPQSGVAAQQLRRAQLAAGQLAASGPGVTVTLSNPPTRTASAAARGGTVPITATTSLTDRDVRSVVDELWHDGAEAVSVNDIRLTPTSAIRFAGQAVLVDLQPITAPYRIRAIGNGDDLVTAFAQSSVASRYQTLEGVEHIGFSFADSAELHLPPGAPDALRYAKPVPTTPKAPPSPSRSGHR